MARSRLFGGVPQVNTDDYDRHPLVIGSKEALRTSTSTTLRSRPPTNPHTASKNVNFVFDHSIQMPVWPNGGASLIESTRMTGSSQYSTMNKSGKPYALGTMVGGAPDQRGTLLSSKSPKAKITK